MAAFQLDFPDYPDNLVQRARRVRLVCFDVDGTLTDGRLIQDSDGRELKQFHAHDGQGMALLRDMGMSIAMITARASRVTELRAAELRVQAYTAVKNKLEVVLRISRQMGIGLEQVAFMGDDLADLIALSAVGLSVAPANAHRWVASQVHWKTTARGGEGAAREFCDLLLFAQGHAHAVLQRLGNVPADDR